MAAPERFAHGLDISKYDIHYRAPVRAVDFVIQRASYGLKSDERFEQLHAEIQPVPLRGAYHYFYTGIPWQQQAEHFLRLITGRGYHFLALDYELLYNNLNAASAQDAQRIMRFWRAESGQQVLLYCNPNVYENYFLPYGNWMREWPLWISQWHSKWWYQNRANAPKLPRGVSDWAFWQYGGDYQNPSGLWSVPGYNEGAAWGVDSKHVDLDVFNGTPEELRQWARVGHQSDSNEPPITQKNSARLDELARMESHIAARRAEMA